MSPLARSLRALALQTQTVQWERPPAGSLRRGVLWASHPRVAVALAIVALAALLGLALYRRFRRRTKLP